jgi:hypothetical protein
MNGEKESLMKRITLNTGNYGSGKTNFAVNLALQRAKEGKNVTVVDLDIVNPYFRTADFADLFQQNGIRLEKTLYANTSLDIPAISFDLARMAQEADCLVIDVGGDDAGAIALGRYATSLAAYQEELDMLYVVNRYRYLTAKPEEALALLYEIEQAARIRHTGIVNNSNLGRETTAELVKAAVPYAETIAETAGLPLVCTTYREDLPVQVKNGFPVQVYVKPVWEQDAWKGGI